jgi:hypothetical protein
MTHSLFLPGWFPCAYTRPAEESNELFE